MTLLPCDVAKLASSLAVELGTLARNLVAAATSLLR
jgi:hypothetical protein